MLERSSILLIWDCAHTEFLAPVTRDDNFNPSRQGLGIGTIVTQRVSYSTFPKRSLFRSNLVRSSSHDSAYMPTTCVWLVDKQHGHLTPTQVLMQGLIMVQNYAFSAARRHTDVKVLTFPGVPLFTCQHLHSWWISGPRSFLSLYWVNSVGEAPFPEEVFSNSGHAPNYLYLTDTW